MRRAPVILVAALLIGCASMRNPVPAVGTITTTSSVHDAVPAVMAELESLGYRIEQVERGAGLIKGVMSNALAAVRVTVTLREHERLDGLRFRVVGQASSGPGAAEEAAREVRRRLTDRFN